MNPLLTDQHRDFRDELREFAERWIAPVAAEFDRKEVFPWANVRRMADAGYLGIPIPEELSGKGLDYMSYILAVEEFARIDVSHGITVSAHTTLGTTPILHFGSDEQRERFVPPLASGQVLGGFGLTEAGAGSDAGGTRTRAVAVDGGYRINGAKVFITHAGVGEVFTVTAVTDPSAGTRGITNFVVCKPTSDLDAAAAVGMGHLDDLPFTEGVKAGKKEVKMGWRASDTCELLLDDAFVPEAHRVGEIGEGFVNFLKTLDAGRVGIAGLSLGLAQGALDTILRFMVESGSSARRNDQQIQFMIAELATEVEAARHLTYHAAWLKDQGLPFGKEAAMAKLFASELAMKATREGVKAIGAAAYGKDLPLERMLRDAKVCEIGEGTSEVQKLVISRKLVKDMEITLDRQVSVV